MKLLILIALLLSGCTTSSQNSFSQLFSECHFNSQGEVTNYPCLSYNKYPIDNHITYSVKHDIREYKITYKPHHKYSEVYNICQMITNKSSRACVLIDRDRKKAAIWYVYGDEAALYHEKQHIIWG